MAQTINVNTTPGQFMPTLYYSQGDIGREFEIVLASSDGWSIPAGSTVEMVATKPSGLGFTVSGTLSGNVASFVTTETMTNEWGRYPAEIRIKSGTDVIGTANFYLNGERNPHPDGTTDGNAESLIPELTVLVERVEAAAASVLDMTVVAETLPAGSDATYSYDEETNTATFGIPRGRDGEVTFDALNDATAVQSVSDSTPYLFRQTNEGNAGHNEWDEIVGGTVAWNQLCNGSSVTVPSGHKYYMIKSGTASIGASSGSAITGLTSGTDIVIDLTQMFGTTIADAIYAMEQATAGSGVAWFKKLFPKAYYPYDAGTLKSVEGLTSHDMTGKNLLPITTDSIKSLTSSYVTWSGNIGSYRGLTYTLLSDESNKLGGIIVNGTASANAWFRLVPNTYDIKQSAILSGCPAGGNGNTYSISVLASDDATSIGTDIGSGVAISASDNINAYLLVRSGTTINNLVFRPMLRLASVTDDTYEPYELHSYPLDSDLTLRGIPKLDANNNLYYDGDVYASDGTVTRKYGIVDLGTLSWSYDSNGFMAGWNIETTVKHPSSSSTMVSLVCGRIEPNTAYNIYNGQNGIGIHTNGSVRVRTADMGTDATAFKTAMSGVYLVYELATPTTETADPYQHAQVCAPYGTEEYVTTSIVPVGHNTEYPKTLSDIKPTANGNYVLKCTVTNGVATYEWVSA